MQGCASTKSFQKRILKEIADFNEGGNIVVKPDSYLECKWWLAPEAKLFIPKLCPYIRYILKILVGQKSPLTKLRSKLDPSIVDDINATRNDEAVR